MILRKPAVSKSPFDWQLGENWMIEYENSIPFLRKSSSLTSTDIVMPLPLPGRYRLKLIGNGSGVLVNGVSTVISPMVPKIVEFDSGINEAIIITASTATFATITVEHFDNEFFVEGVTNASLIFDSQDIRTPNKRSAARSRNITVPPTDNNLRALGELFEINHEGDFDPRKRADCHITIDSVTVLSGYAQVISINKGGNIWKEINSTEVQVFDELSELFSSLGDKKVNDISFAEYTHNLNSDDITFTGWREDPDEHKVKKLGSYLPNFTHTLVGTADVSLHLDGTDVIGGGLYFYKFTTSTTHGLVVGDFVWVKKNSNLSGDTRKFIGEHRVREVIDGNNFVVSTNSSGVSDVTGAGDPIGSTDCTIWKRDSLGFGYCYVPADLGLDADIAMFSSVNEVDLGATYQHPSQPSSIWQYAVCATRMRPSVFLKEVFIKAVESVGFEIISSFIETNQDFNRIMVLPWHKEGVERDNYSVSNANYTPYDSVIDPTDFLPEVKLSDLIGDVIKMFNLYVRTEGRKLFIEPRDSFFNQQTTDWNDRIDQSSIKIKLLPELTGREYEYSAAKPNDIYSVAYSEAYGQFGNLTKEVTNEFSGDKKISTSLVVVEPTIIVSSRFNPGTLTPSEILYSTRRNFYSASSKANDGKPLRKGVRLVYLSPKGIAGYKSSPYQTKPFIIWKRWYIEDDGPQDIADGSRFIFPAGTHVDSVNWPMFDLNFLTNPERYPQTWGSNVFHIAYSTGRLYTDSFGLYHRYHSQGLNSSSSKRSRMVSGSGLFTLQDVALLDFRSLISFDGQLYQLNKFDIDLTTMVGKFELLLMQDIGSTEYIGPIEGSPIVSGKVVEQLMSAISDVTHISANDSLVIDSVADDPVTVGKPTRPLQELRIVTKVNFNLEGKDTLIDGSVSPKSIAIGETLLWTRDGVDWETISTPTMGYSGYSGIGQSGYSGYSGVSSSGYSGYSGTGVSGYSGAIGYSGYSGFSGASPTSTVKNQIVLGANSTSLAVSTSYFLGYSYGITMQSSVLNVTNFVFPVNATITGCVFCKSGGAPASTTAELYLVPNIGSDVKLMDLNMSSNVFQYSSSLSVGILSSLTYVLEIRMGSGSTVVNCTPRVYLSYQYNL